MFVLSRLGWMVADDDQYRIPEARVDFDLGRVRFDTVDRGGTDLCQHESSDGQVTAKAQSGIFSEFAVSRKRRPRRTDGMLLESTGISRRIYGLTRG